MRWCSLYPTRPLGCQLSRESLWCIQLLWFEDLRLLKNVEYILGWYLSIALFVKYLSYLRERILINDSANCRVRSTNILKQKYAREAFSGFSTQLCSSFFEEELSNECTVERVFRLVCPWMCNKVRSKVNLDIR